MKRIGPFGKFSLASQTSSNSTTANPLIPSGISANCAQFLNNLDNNSTISTCVNALLNATSQFAPGGNAGSASSASITDALDAIHSTNLCPEYLFRGKLAEFYSQCPEELTTSNSVTGVINIYGVLYAVLPFVGAICSKDDNDNYCLLEKISSSSPSSLASDIGTSNTQSVLDSLVNSPSVERRDATTAITPNAT